MATPSNITGCPKALRRPTVKMTHKRAGGPVEGGRGQRGRGGPARRASLRLPPRGPLHLARRGATPGERGHRSHCGKIESVVNNACRACELVEEQGSLAAFLWRFEPTAASRPRHLTWEVLRSMPTTLESTALSKELRRRGWTFVGPTTSYAFMQAMGLVQRVASGGTSYMGTTKVVSMYAPGTSAVTCTSQCRQAESPITVEVWGFGGGSLSWNRRPCPGPSASKRMSWPWREGSVGARGGAAVGPRAFSAGAGVACTRRRV